MKSPFSKSQQPAAAPKEPGKLQRSWQRFREVGINPELLFQKTRPPPCPRHVYFNEPLPEDYFDQKGRPLPHVSYATNQGGFFIHVRLMFGHSGGS